MANRIYIPIINPLKFVDAARASQLQYYTKQFDEFLFEEQLYEFEQSVDGTQIFSPHDIVSLQYSANYSPLQITFVNVCTGAIPIAFTASSNIKNTYEPDYWLYEFSVDISALPAGDYYVQIDGGSPVQKTIQSETFRIIQNIRNTVFIEYANSEYYEDVIFETGIKLGMRVPGFLRYDMPGSQDVVYQDQNLNNTILSSNHFRNYKLIVGAPSGVPPWFIDRIDRIIGCDNLTVDGKVLSKPEGAQWEKHEEKDYPMQGWSIQMREAINRKSVIFDSEGQTDKKVLIVHNVDSKGFGDIYAPGQNVVPIIDLE